MERGNVLNSTGSIASSKRSDVDYNRVKEKIERKEAKIKEEETDYSPIKFWNDRIAENNLHNRKEDWGKVGMPSEMQPKIKAYQGVLERLAIRKNNNLPVDENFLAKAEEIISQSPPLKIPFIQFGASGEIALTHEETPDAFFPFPRRKEDFGTVGISSEMQKNRNS